VQADVALQDDVDRMMNAVLDRFGALHVLVNNAGICPFHEFLSMSVELWDRVHAVNLRGTFLCSQSAARAMIEREIKGRIISISSISAKVGGAEQCHYTPTKSGQESLMRSMAIVLGPHGITCNSVAPGVIETDINAEDLSDRDKRSYMESRTPAGRLGMPEDIGGPVAFLASDEAAYVTGASLLVDGGLFVNLQ
jgi:L-rhamnose 1-dehydrogenase